MRKITILICFLIIISPCFGDSLIKASNSTNTIKIGKSFEKLINNFKARQKTEKKIRNTFARIQGEKNDFANKELAEICYKLKILESYLKVQSGKGRGNRFYWLFTEQINSTQGLNVAFIIANIIKEDCKSQSDAFKSILIKIATKLAKDMQKHKYNEYSVFLDYWHNASSVTDINIRHATECINSLISSISDLPQISSNKACEAHCKVIATILQRQLKFGRITDSIEPYVRQLQLTERQATWAYKELYKLANNLDESYVKTRIKQIGETLQYTIDSAPTNGDIWFFYKQNDALLLKMIDCGKDLEGLF